MMGLDGASAEEAPSMEDGLFDSAAALGARATGADDEDPESLVKLNRLQNSWLGMIKLQLSQHLLATLQNTTRKDGL